MFARLPLTLLATAVLALTGCGDDDAETAPPPPPDASAAATPALAGSLPPADPTPSSDARIESAVRALVAGSGVTDPLVVGELRTAVGRVCAVVDGQPSGNGDVEDVLEELRTRSANAVGFDAALATLDLAVAPRALEACAR